MKKWLVTLKNLLSIAEYFERVEAHLSTLSAKIDTLEDQMIKTETTLDLLYAQHVRQYLPSGEPIERRCRQDF